MKTRVVGILVGLLAVASSWAQLSILSFDRQGRLTWTNCSATAVYRIEWAATLGPNGTGFQVLSNFSSITATGALMSVQLPVPTTQSIFYRVVWVDAPRPEGEFYYVAYDPLVGPELPCVVGTLNLSVPAGAIRVDWDFYEDLGYCIHPLGAGSGQGLSDGCYLLLGAWPFWLSGEFNGEIFAGIWTYIDLVETYVGEFIAVKVARSSPAGPPSASP